MQPKLKFTIMWTSLWAFFGCGQINSKNDQTEQANKAEQYVSISCGDGDITLTLNTDKTFDLTILLWDSLTHEHTTGKESVKGNWIKADKLLALTTVDSNKIYYELTTRNMKIPDYETNIVTYKFRENVRDFFATGFELLEKEHTDDFLRRWRKQN